MDGLSARKPIVMASGKWIPDLTPETATVDAARRALSLRLEALREALGAALDSIDDDLEHIHQLRVACRRATAAVDLFEVCLPRKTAKKARQLLRTFRRAAGDARDWDVWLLQLSKRLRANSADDLPGIDMLFGYCMAHRIPAQECLESICPDYPFEYERWMTNTLSALQAPEAAFAQRVADLGPARLIPQFERFWKSLQQPNLSWTELHDTRIEAKRLRYGVELLAAALPSGLQEAAYQQLSEVQSILGDANDGFVALQRLEELQRRLPELFRRAWPRWSPFIETLIREQRQQMQGARDRFEHWKQSAEHERLDVVFHSLFSGESTSTNGQYAIVQAS